MWYRNICELIGNTPLVQLGRMASEVKPTVLVKIESFNPGNSVKDRIAWKMIEDAEKSGQLKPGGTIIENTSGNTGMGLALVASLKGYKTIFTIADKQSQEKVDLLRALGAEVIVCPTNVAPDDPRSYYSVARQLSKELPNSYFPNQYDNPSNTQTHYETTGPEVWEGTEGKVTHFVAGMGTCGTVSGVSKYLKEQSDTVQVIGIDTEGSIFKKYKETGEFDKNEIYPYFTEGIGEDILPQNADFSLVDRVEKVSDKDAFLAARKLARIEGIFTGGSGGSAVAGGLRIAAELGKKDLVVILLPDHGSRYLGKVFNDVWMKAHGFLDGEARITVQDLLSRRTLRRLLSVAPTDSLSQAMALIKEHDISQLPVVEAGIVVGSVTESALLAKVLEDPVYRSKSVKEVMGKPFPEVLLSSSIDQVAKMISRETPAVMVKARGGEFDIITQYDLISIISE